MPLYSESQESEAIIELKIDGYWKASDFADCFIKIDELYAGLNTLFFFSEALRHEQNAPGKRSTEAPAFHNLWHGESVIYSYLKSELVEEVGGRPIDIESLIGFVKTYSGTLDVNSIRYGSPGWIEFIGNLNPLKVIADAVGEYREQNTIRERDRQQAEIARKKNRMEAENERRRIDGDLLKAAFEHAPHLFERNNGRLTEVNKKIIIPANKTIAELGRDSRIKDVTVKRKRKKADQGQSLSDIDLD